jgi:hypothetical protein
MAVHNIYQQIAQYHNIENSPICHNKALELEKQGCK